MPDQREQLNRLKDALTDRYVIVRKLGQGGMAIVYLAKDLRHDRKVAIKVLRPELAAILGAERFVQEIKTTANLQHRHILPLFDSGEAGGFLYYVMPYVDGVTLRDKLNRERQLGIEEAVKFTIDIADALDYAHRNHVIHRDIKPENILLHEGRPLVADFGIALAVSEAGGTRLTETGLSLGTPQYMSPEQAAGDREAGAQSDVYSLGCVLYEMLAGEPPHTGKTVQAIIAKVVAAEAQPVCEVRHTVPPNVDAALRRTLAKVPADRFDGAIEFAKALTNPAFRLAPVPGAVVGKAIGRERWDRTASIGWGIAALATGLALWGWLRPGPPEPVKPVIRYNAALPWGRSVTTIFHSKFALSPDGQRLVYVGLSEGFEGGPTLELQRGQLWVRSRDQLPSSAARIPGTEEAWNPFFSPDGARVGFLHSSSNSLKIVALDGRPPTTVAEGVGRAGASWGADGYIYLNMSGGGIGLARVPASGGDPEPLTTLDTARGEIGHLWPEVLPNGKGVLFTVWDGGGSPSANVAVLDLASSTYRVLVGGVGAKYAASRHVVYVTADGTLMAAPFDEDALVLTGEATALVEGVSVGFRSFDLALSATGTLMYTTSTVGAADLGHPVWVKRDGTAEEIDPGWTGDFIAPTLSPDGKRLAVGIQQNDEQHIWIKQLDRGPLSRLTFEGTFNYWPAWTPDGQAVAFVSVRGDQRNVYLKRADGGGPATLLRQGEPVINEVSYSPDGEWLVYRTGSGSTGGGRDLYAVRIGTEDAPVPLVTTEFEESSPAVSPDGRWLAYVSNRSGRSEVYVRPFPNTGDRRWRVSLDGGVEPVWAHSGGELFYKSGGNLMSIGVLPGDTFVMGTQRVLFATEGLFRVPYAAHALYDVTPDDQRFVMIRMQHSALGELIVVENFFEELKQKVGT